MSERTVSTQSDSERSSRHDLSPARPQLFLALECDRPLCPAQAVPLDGADLLVVGRGHERRVADDGAGSLCRRVLRLPDARLSREHARFVRAHGRWIFEDAGSKNGSLANGVRCRRKVCSDGDLFEVGHTFLLYRDAVPPPGGHEPPAPNLRTFVGSLAEGFATLARIAPSAVSVMLLGETGTGKEVLARALHQLSGRGGPFVAVNCGALPETLVESLLFGHRRGAYSGAIEDRPGMVRTADHGTLFLDEIGDLPPDSQTAFLRFLQEGEVVPVGEARPIKVDVRLVTATHRDLAALTESGRFRRDLLARMSGFTLRLPPLRERTEDLGLLVAALLERLGPPGGRVTFTPAVARALFRYDWPLNVRELEKCLSTAVAVAGGERIDVRHLPDTVRGPSPAAAPPLAPADERRLRELAELLDRHDGNVSRVAAELGKGRTQIHRWLKRLRLDAERYRR